MGYYTKFEIDIDDIKNADADIKNAFYSNNLENFISERNDYKQNPFYERCKWYNHEKFMKRFSEQYPNILFILSGYGEDVLDIWKKYFKNGKMQHVVAKLSFDEYDETKLE